MESRTSFRYLMVGLINTAFGLSVIYFCILAFHADDTTANATGYAAGIVLSFFLNRRWTFASRGRLAPQLIKFPLVLGTAYLANLATVWTLLNHGIHNRYLAQSIGVVPYTIIGYLGSRIFVFRSTT